MAKASRDKGVRGELYARDLLRDAGYTSAYRTGNQWGDAKVPDVDGSPYWVEAKHGKSPPIWPAVEQALRDRKAADTEERPILIYARKNNRPPLIVMLADEWAARERRMQFWELFENGDNRA